MENKLIDALRSFGQKKVLVIGDVMLDRYIKGDVGRISPEAPVPVVNVKDEWHIPGGAGNTANNISALSGQAYLIGVIGEDNAGKILLAELKRRGINTEGIIVDKSRPTIQKVRVLGQNQQLLRIDYEHTDDLADPVKNELVGLAEKRMSDIDIVVFTDYAKGVLTKDSIKALIQLAQENSKKIIVDPKPKNAVFYKGVDLLTPNHQEACQILGITGHNEELVEVGKKIVKRLNTNVLITRGPKGMSLFEKREKVVKVTDIPTKAKEVYDVSGAGDTVVAATALAMASGTSLIQAAIIANSAAGIVVGKLGMATTSIEELMSAIKQQDSKIKSREEIKRISEELKKAGKTLVTTNGSFDLLHIGHVKFLREAKAQGDVLVVGLNSDASIKQYKSKDRPIIGQEHRAEMLASLDFVDYIVIMDEPEIACPLLRMVKPQVHVNGSDYGENCVEAETVKEVGARLHLVQLVDGFSTSNIIKKIKSEGENE